MLYFIKYFAIVLCGIYCYIKLLNLPKKKNFILPILLFTICLSLLAALSEAIFPHTTILILIFVSVLFFSFIAPAVSPEICITTMIISYGISYISFFIAIIIVGFILVGLLYISIISSPTYNHMLYQILTAFLQLLITQLPFRLKRLKKGMPFLTNRLYRFPLMIISLLVLFLALLMRSTTYQELYFFPILFAFIFAIFIYLSWRNNITKTYLDKLKEKDIAELNAALSQKDIRIKELEEENSELAKIIHGDNKLIPAMALAVKSFLESASALPGGDRGTGQHLLEDLEQMTAHRKGILLRQDNRCHAFHATGVSSVDSLLKYMQQKASEKGTDFVVSVTCDMDSFLRKTISEEDLNTLLADFLENAMIAAAHNSSRHVLLNIDKTDSFYHISIFDSGIPFSKEVLVNLGLQQYTTHKEEGGSGIGLVTSYELIKKYNASLIIEEYAQDSGLYTKKVSLIFNRLGQYTLYTCRDSEELEYLKKRKDLLIIEKSTPE